jgi:hypothetical protein
MMPRRQAATWSMSPVDDSDVPDHLFGCKASFESHQGSIHHGVIARIKSTRGKLELSAGKPATVGPRRSPVAPTT